MLRRALGLWMWTALMAGCVADAPAQTPDGDYDAGDASSEDGLPPGGSPDAVDLSKLDIGWNTGYATQFDYFPDFFAQAIPAGPRLCHAYFSWNVADQAPHAGAVTDQASRAFVDDWFAKAQGACDEALISFKAISPGAVPSTAAYTAAFEKFAATDWAGETGFTGRLSFTPWNEPNNAAGSGNGLGVQIPPRVAARYYLAAERSCRQHNCRVAAGDFASNGNMWNDFEMNCLNDNVAPADLCKAKSAVNTGDAPASYLDVYKNEIVARATEFGLPADFRPEYFAYHGWHDSNRYLDAGDHCSTYATCTLRRILYSLRGSWGAIELWNTEDGIGQTSAPSDDAQACGAAFLMRLQAITSRTKRLYITRLHGGAGELVRDGHVHRPALKLLQQRIRDATGVSCQ